MQMEQVSSFWKAWERSDSIFLKEESSTDVIEPRQGKKTSQNLISVVSVLFITTHSSFSGIQKIKIIIGLQLLIFSVSLFFT